MAMVQLAPQSQQSAMSERNAAAVLSLVCAVVWPLSWLIPTVFNVVTGGQRLPGPILPGLVTALLQLAVDILPFVGVIAGIVGLVRALKEPALRGTIWQALVGLVFGCMWILGILLLSSAGLDLKFWVTHLFA